MEFNQYLLVIWSVLSTLTVVNASVNIARGKTTTQSSVLNDWGSSKAVDGCTKTLMDDNCCTHTAAGHTEAWWQVDLKTESVIETVYITYRDENLLKRFAGFQIYLSNTTDWTSGDQCYQDTTAALASMSPTQSVQCPGVARYLTIYNDRRVKAKPWYSNDAFLELCEVYVYGCPVGKYGNGNCNNDCMNCLNNKCNTTSGTCDVCADGFYTVNGLCVPCPVNCRENKCNGTTGACLVCDEEYFGPFCTPCPVGCITNTCDTGSGYCSQCEPGLHGSFCNQTCPTNCNNSMCNMQDGQCTECDAEYHGSFCNKRCSNNCFSKVCNKSNGQCTKCEPGFHGSFCNHTCPTNCKNSMCNMQDGQCTECDAEYHGSFCNKRCSNNCFSKVCNKSNGQCTKCEPGFHGSFCNHTCPTNCKNSMCNMQDGQCTVTVSTIPTSVIQSECDDGHHGIFCNNPCSTNCLSKRCSISNGQCIECEPGFHDSFCKQKCPTNCKKSICNMEDGQCLEFKPLTSEPASQVGTYAGAGVGAVVLIAVVIVVVIVVLRRRKLQTKENTNTQFDDDLETTLSLPPAKPEHNSHAVSKMAMPVANDNKIEYINVCDVGKKDEEVVYSNMDIQSGVSIDDIRAMIPKKMENEEEEFKNEFKKLPWGAVHPHQEGAKPSNKSKNRFKTTFPYDHSRVILDKVGNDPASTYINANYIDSIDASQAYVACQGPKENTVDDFWRMVWQLYAGKIVMVTNLVEGGNIKCHQYWPDEGEPLTTKHFSITLDRERTYAFYVLREISLTQKKTKQERQVHQFHFTAWPDHGTPDNLELVLFHRRVASYRTHLTGQMVVHCSAGLGRTGTFIGLDVLSKEEKKSGRVDISQYIRTMRKDRMNMVQTHEQYIAVHELLVEAHDLADSLISSTEYPETLKKILPAGKPTNQTKLRKEFEKLQTIIPKYDPSCYTAGMMKENKDKNRSMSNIAVDTFRAYLRSQARGRTDYINAVMLQSHRSKSGYLITQIPLEDTVDDFWTMVTDYNCENIVVLGNPTEHWLREESEVDQAHEVYVKKQNVLEVISDVDIVDYLVTSKSSSNDKTIRIFTLKQWSSDSLLPPSDSSLFLLLEQLDSRRRPDNTTPVVVMCRNGCTQSGLFCCISNIRDQMKMDEEVDIFQNARQIQIRRPHALRNIEQYQYCYNFISQYLESTNVYIN